MAKRTLQVRAEGMAIFAKYARHLRDAEGRDESPPAPQADAEVIADWLAERDLLEGISKEEAALLIELVGQGGRGDVEEEPE